MKSFNPTLWLVVALSFMQSPPVWAWGERGHHMICEVATRLVQEPGLKHLLFSKGHMMGHVCNIPDILWRRNKDQVAEIAAQAHFMNPENAGLTIEQAPTDINQYYALEKNSPNSTAKSEKLGSLWWRAKQFYDRAAQQATAAKQASQAMVKGTDELKKAASADYDKAVFGMMVNMGLMGHFIGDSTMPFHNSSDYDGWETGHGGIHSFYETVCVGQLDLGVEAEIYKAAQSVKRPTSSVPLLEAFKAISVESFNEKKTIEALDKILEPSKGKKEKAKRDVPATACGAFHDLQIKELARAAANLAYFWDEAYSEGAPNLEAYHSFDYPLAPELVPVDYLPK